MLNPKVNNTTDTIDSDAPQRKTAEPSLMDAWRRASQAGTFQNGRDGVPIDDDDVRYKPLSLKLLRRLLGRLKPYRRLYLLGALFGLVALSLELTTPVIIQRIVDVAIPSGEAGQVLALAGLWAAVMLVSLLFTGVQIGITYRAGARVIHDLRLAIFHKLQQLSMSFFDKTKLGRIITRGTSDLQTLTPTVRDGVQLMMTNSLMMLGAGAMILWTDWRLFLSLIWLLPLLTVMNRRYRRQLGQQHQIVRAHYSRVASNMAENITGVRIVSAFNRQEENLERFNDLQVINTVNNLRLAHIMGVYQPVLELLRFVGQAMILLCGGLLVLRGTITPGAVLAVLFYWGFFMRPTITLGTFYSSLMRAMASGERIFSLLDLEPEIKDAPRARDLPRLKGHIRFKNVTFAYEPGRPVLHGINLDLPAGKTYAIVGATGSGKTSMLALLARFYNWQEGRIKIDGHAIRRYTLRSLRRQIGMVLQTNYLFTGTILDNIRYARPEASAEEAHAAARALDVHETFLALPDGYQTDVGERGDQISMGLRQLICFVRVLLVNPSIFLLDEATSSIDTVTENKVQQALGRLSAGRTTVIVAHRLSTIVRADRIIVMDQGRIAEQGSHAELLARGGQYAAMYEWFVSPEKVLGV